MTALPAEIEQTFGHLENAELWPPAPESAAESSEEPPDSWPIERGQIVLNRFAADDLGVGRGDTIRLTWYEVGEREELITRQRDFDLLGVVGMSGLGADPELTPEYPGVSDADDMSDWEPTFPVDLSQIRSIDEEYWDSYRGAPKAFLNQAEGREMWGSRFGDLSEIRLAPAGRRQ